MNFPTQLRRLCLLVSLAASPFLKAQALPDQRYGLEAGQTPAMEIGFQYQATHANAPPTDCGCFWMQGGGLQLNFAVHPRWSIAVDLDGANAARINGTDERLSLFNYVAGPRYSYRTHSRFTPYAQALAGGSEVFSNYVVYGSGRNVFAAETGGGLEYRMNRRLAIIPIEADWVFSRALNGVNTRQNNTRLGAGIAVRMGPR